MCWNDSPCHLDPAQEGITASALGLDTIPLQGCLHLALAWHQATLKLTSGICSSLPACWWFYCSHQLVCLAKHQSAVAQLLLAVCSEQQSGCIVPLCRPLALQKPLQLWCPPLTLALRLARLITPAMTVLEQVPLLPLLPGLHWPVVLCLLGSQCPSATPTSWHQGYVTCCSRPGSCAPVHVIYAACHARAAHVLAVCIHPYVYHHATPALAWAAFIMLGNLLF